MQVLNAEQIKHYLNKGALKKYANCKNSLLTDELKVCAGKAIADLAVINGSLSCFEIKSDYDSLKRLDNQIENYDSVFDYITIVVGGKHVEKAVKKVPKHWGVWCISNSENGNDLIQRRKPKKNRNVSAFHIAQFLWKEEAIELLKEFGVPGNFQKKRKWLLWEEIAREIPLETLKKKIRSILLSREGWINHPGLS